MFSARVYLLAGVLVLACFVQQASYAQIGEIDAEFAGAGARPLSMGGAFLALADDSTAAEFNPAGIRILPRPEFAWQVTRTFDRREEYLPGSSYDRFLDTGELVSLRGSDTNQWTTPSFISYVYPGQDWTIAFSQLTTIDFVHHYTDPAESFFFESKTEATNNAFGLTIARDIKPRLHVGLTLRMNRFDFETFDTDAGSLAFSDWSPSANAGVLWRANKDWSFGAVYKSSQKLEALDGLIDTTLPETWGAGVAYHPNDRLRLLADIDYINWSEFDNLTDDAYRRNDVTRYHLGGEYLLDVNKDRAWFARAGYMLEESNALYFDGPGTDLNSTAFPEEDDMHHLTIGIGLAKEKYQLDLAVDQVLDGPTTLILAMIHYF